MGFALPPGVPVPDSLVPSNGRVLEVSGIVASYGRRDRRKVVLDGVSLSLGSGECLALVGESGSGKTTLGRCIAGLHRPDSGTVLFAGRPLAPTAQARPQTDLRALQIVFQNPDRSLNPAETVADAIRRPLRLFGGELTKRTPRDAVAELLDQVRLPLESANKYPRDLSGGEKQRVAIARALAAEPAVLICDEITSSLDVSIQAAVIRLLNDLRSTGLSLLFITHNLGLVNAVADRIVVLESGRVCEEGEVSRVIASPQHPYTLELVTAAPEIHSGS